MNKSISQARAFVINEARLPRKLLVLSLVIMLLCWSQPNPAQADAGELDRSFGSGGLVTLDVSGDFDEVCAVAALPDNKILVMGNGSTFARYTSEGVLDPTFGLGGIITDFKLGHTFAMTIGPDQKILAVGLPGNNPEGDTFQVVRFNKDGSPDSSFGRDGVAAFRFFTIIAHATAVAIDPDGGILLTGTVYNRSTNNQDFGLVRFNSDGSLDTSFGSGGRVLTDFSNEVDFPLAIAVQPDGKILAAGEAFLTTQGGGQVFALARYNRDGSLDSSFGAGGRVTSVFSGRSSFIRDIALQNDGKIIAAGQIEGIKPPFTNTTDFAIARYNADGSLDESFGTRGLTFTDFSQSGDQITSLVLMDNGKIVVAGYADNGDSRFDFALARYNADGSLDSSFGKRGKITTKFSGGFSQAFSIALQSDGRAVVGGTAQNGTIGSNFTTRGFALARYELGIPRIINVSIMGKKLTVTGAGFDSGAVILVDGERQKTTNDGQNPNTILISKKAGKKINVGQTVTIQIRNSDGSLSQGVSFARSSA